MKAELLDCFTAALYKYKNLKISYEKFESHVPTTTISTPRVHKLL